MCVVVCMFEVVDDVMFDCVDYVCFLLSLKFVVSGGFV